MVMALVTLQQAKRHLRILHSDEDDDILEKAEHASAIVLDYIQRPDLEWTDAVDGSPSTPSDAPFVIQAAVLMVLDILWERRGSEEVEYTQADGYLSKPVTAILHRYAKLSYA
jgi:hypothetical protein